MANVDTVILCIKGSNAVVLVGVIVIAVEEEAVEMASWFSKIARFVSKVVNSLLTCPRLDIETFLSSTCSLIFVCLGIISASTRVSTISVVFNPLPALSTLI